MGRPSVEQIRPGAEVYCTDGRIGNVIDVEAGDGGGAQLLRVRQELTDRQLEIPFDLVDALAEDGSVRLACASTDLVAAGGAGSLGSRPAPRVVEGSGAERLELREEAIVPHTEMREAGQVRLRKEVEAVPREIEVQAAREQVAVEHVPVGEVVPERRAPWREGDVLVVPVYEEQVEVVKRLVLREQLRIRLETTTEAHHFPETVLRERVVIEDSTGKGFVREYYAAAPEEQSEAHGRRDTDSTR